MEISDEVSTNSCFFLMSTKKAISNTHSNIFFSID